MLLNGLPKARVQNLIKEDYQKTAIAELYAKVSPSKLTCIQKSKKGFSFSLTSTEKMTVILYGINTK